MCPHSCPQPHRAGRHRKPQRYRRRRRYPRQRRLSRRRGCPLSSLQVHQASSQPPAPQRYQASSRRAARVVFHLRPPQRYPASSRRAARVVFHLRPPQRYQLRRQQLRSSSQPYNLRFNPPNGPQSVRRPCLPWLRLSVRRLSRPGFRPLPHRRHRPDQLRRGHRR